jgi:glycosyltransferase involved in cell wall biosynthesis
MRMLVLSPYPPMHGGISAYAGQAVLQLRSEGHKVAVVSPEPSDADFTLDIRRPGAGLRLARLARGYDRLIVQFQPEMFGDAGTPRSVRARAFLRLAAGLWAARSAELCVHEVVYGEGGIDRLLRTLVRPVLKLADLLTVHTERERNDLSRAFRIDLDRIRVVSQGASLLRRTSANQAAARAALGVPEDGLMLLAIGFLHPRKGFDRAIRSFAELNPECARLYVVGSLWREDEISQTHLEELRGLAHATPGVELHVGYLSDEEFDRWIVAADALILPYRSGWSSNVMERGLLYDRPVIMSNVGGMSEQGTDRPRVTLVEGDAGLPQALRTAIEVARGRRDTSWQA